VQRDLTDRRAGAEVQLDRLRVAERARPARPSIALAAEVPAFSALLAVADAVSARLAGAAAAPANDGIATAAASTTAAAARTFLIPLPSVVRRREAALITVTWSTA
jgi:hypothetical protein